MHFETNTIYHIYNQGNNQQQIYFSRENYLFFLRKMRKHILPYGDLLCYCLMPNHFHWMVYVREEGCELPNEPYRSDGSKPSDRSQKKQPLTQGIATLLSSYTQAINKQNNWSGSLFRSKTKAIPCIETTLKTLKNNNLYQPYYVEKCFEYIHQNPVTAQLVQKAEDWEYSSATDYSGVRNGTLCNINLAREMEII